MAAIPGATILVQNGALEQGQDFICGSLAGRVRAMFDERGDRVEQAGPSVPVQVLGFGATVEYVQLPFEAHGYAGLESVEDVVARMIAWYDKYVKGAAGPGVP